ncbi:hypothetical protein [Subtercola sp. RTI3]|uniref:hypothetical protein n=1 Tax=Subtercola sp. RTI3 TaxID=3048639 RepID=UPI002B2255FD|nr:hypothetical protein [Subtercola sp. RTI3]MEA9983647.1 hypothetical protein [Subtercola sp. RTI3]
MLSHKEKVAKAKKARRNFKIVVVAMDSDATDERDALMAEIAAADSDKRAGMASGVAARASLAKLDAAEVESLVTVKIYRSDPSFWARLSAQVGYSTESTLKAAIMVDARILEGTDELVQTTDEWEEFFSTLAPSSYSLLTQASYMLNETEPTERIERLKKVLESTGDSAPS